MTKTNIGLINAMLRMTFGFAMLAWATAKMVKRPWCKSYFWVAITAGMKISEGITRFCPLTALFEQYQNKEQHQQPKKESLEIAEKIDELVNPS